MLIKFNNDNSKCKLFVTISTISTILGFVFVFIKPLFGILFLIIGGGLNLYLHKRFPDFMKSLINEQQKTHAGAWVQKYNVKHIQGIDFVDFGREITLQITKQNVSFLDSGKNVFSFENDKIENAAILEEIEQTQKNKSVVGRAIVGGLLLGGVGAIVGGLSGACPEMKTNRKYYLEISGADENKIIVTAENGVLKQIKTALSSIAK